MPCHNMFQDHNGERADVKKWAWKFRNGLCIMAEAADIVKHSSSRANAVIRMSGA